MRPAKPVTTSWVVGALWILGIFALADCSAKTVMVLRSSDGGASDSDSGTTRQDGAGGTTGDASSDAFVCVPPDGSTSMAMSFSGTRFDPKSACLTSDSITLPVCGCFRGTGHDSSTWCFAAPDGTVYFSVSADGCDVEMAPGWYATQTFGLSPFGSPTAAQSAACALLADSSTSKGSYDMPGPPVCLSSCNWPADLNPPDSGLGTWKVGRTLLQCGIGSGASVCVSDNDTACPGTDAGAGGGLCGDVCAVTEYGVIVSYDQGVMSPDGGPPPMYVDPNLPASCHRAEGISANPEYGYECCTCE